MSHFTTAYDEVGESTGWNSLSPRSDPLDDLCPIPANVGPLVFGLDSEREVQDFLSGTEMRRINKYCALNNINTAIKEKLSTAFKSLGLDFEEDTVKIASINSAILWGHSTARPNFAGNKDNEAMYTAMQQEAITKHPETVKHLSLLYEATGLGCGTDGASGLASICSVARFCYGAGLSALDLPEFEDIVKHDLTEQRWAAFDEFWKEHDLESKCNELQKSGTKQSRGTRDFCRALFRAGSSKVKGYIRRHR